MLDGPPNNWNEAETTDVTNGITKTWSFCIFQQTMIAKVR